MEHWWKCWGVNVIVDYRVLSGGGYVGGVHLSVEYSRLSSSRFAGETDVNVELDTVILNFCYVSQYIFALEKKF